MYHIYQPDRGWLTKNNAWSNETIRLREFTHDEAIEFCKARVIGERMGSIPVRQDDVNLVMGVPR